MRRNPISKGRSVRKRRGAVTLEATLLLPLFLIFWFGIVDWGFAFFVHESVVHNANAAARWAVVNDFDAVKVKQMFLYGDPNAAGSGSAWFSFTKPDVQVTLAGDDTTNDHRLVVTVSNYQWMHFTPFFAGRYLGSPITVTLPAESLNTDE